MHIKRCMMHKCIIMKHLMHEGSYKDRKNQIKDQKSKSSTIGTLLHPNRTIFWNECLRRSETTVGRMRTGDTHRLGGKNIKTFFQKLTIFPQNRFSFHSTTSKKLKFLFSFDFFKSLKLRAMRSQMTKGTTMVTNNVFRPTRLFGKGQQHGFVLFSTYDIEVLYEQSHYNGGKQEKAQIHSIPQDET